MLKTRSLEDAFWAQAKKEHEANENLIYLNLLGELNTNQIPQEIFDRFNNFLRSPKSGDELLGCTPKEILKKFIGYNQDLRLIGGPAKIKDTEQDNHYIYSIVSLAAIKELVQQDFVAGASSKFSKKLKEVRHIYVNSDINFEERDAQIKEILSPFFGEINTILKQRDTDPYYVKNADRKSNHISWLSYSDEKLQFSATDICLELGLERSLTNSSVENDVHFVISLHLSQKAYENLRKPTIFSEGNPEIYASFCGGADEEGYIDTYQHKLSQWGRTMNLKNGEISRPEAIIPRSVFNNSIQKIDFLGLIDYHEYEKCSLPKTERIKKVKQQRAAMLQVEG